MHPEILTRRLVTELSQYRYSYQCEKQLHEGIAEVLTTVGIPFVREHVAGPTDRFDFLCENGVVIEAKIKGSLSEALRQIDRYCLRQDVTTVILVATPLWSRHGRLRAGARLRGKPIHVVHVGGQSF